MGFGIYQYNENESNNHTCIIGISIPPLSMPIMPSLLLFIIVDIFFPSFITFILIDIMY